MNDYKSTYFVEINAKLYKGVGGLQVEVTWQRYSILRLDACWVISWEAVNDVWGAAFF